MAQDQEATGRAKEFQVIAEAKKVLMGTTSETHVKKADNAAGEADLPDCPGE